MSIGILGAMPEEVDILRAEMLNVTLTTIAGREYYTGELYGIQTTLVFSRWGKVASAIAATTLISRFAVNSILFVGVAGAVNDDLNVGDVVVGRQLYQHDMDARPLFSQFEIPLTGQVFFDADRNLCDWAVRAAKSFCLKGIKEVIPSEVLAEFSIIKPVCYSAVIGSGDVFVATALQRETIIRAVPEVLAVEMEGAAVAQVCHEHGLPFVVVRIISDKADHSAQIDFPRFVTGVAKYYSKSIIEGIYKMMLMESVDSNAAISAEVC